LTSIYNISPSKTVRERIISNESEADKEVRLARQREASANFRSGERERRNEYGNSSLSAGFDDLDRSTDDISHIYDRNLVVLQSDLLKYRSDPLMAQHLFWETSGLSKFEFGNTEVVDKAA
jgi:hypothetical protein